MLGLYVGIRNGLTTFVTYRMLGHFKVCQYVGRVNGMDVPRLVKYCFGIRAMGRFSIVDDLFSRSEYSDVLCSFSVFVPVVTPLLSHPHGGVLPGSLGLHMKRQFTVPI